MDSSEGFATGPAIGAAASEDGRDDSDASAQPPMESSGDCVSLIEGPPRCPIERARRLHRGIAVIRMHAATGEHQQLQQAARGLEITSLAILADERAPAKVASAA